MLSHYRTIKTILSLLLLFLAFAGIAEVKLPRLIADGMVLQRDKNINIWGWADPGEKITVTFNNKTYNQVTSSDGKWKVSISPTKAGGPFNMTIKGNNEIEINNIMMGDVWVCSGQSNMALTMERVKEKYPDVIAASENENIRHFFVATYFDFSGPQEDYKAGSWKTANPENVLQFSAVAYFFAKDLYEKNKVPIGLINASVGGSPVEAWLSEEKLIPYPAHLNALQVVKKTNYIDSIRNSEANAQKDWFSLIKQNDKGSQQGQPKWYEQNIDVRDWKLYTVPGSFKEQGVIEGNGVIWFRKEIDLPESMKDKPAKLFLGRLVDSDSTYVNGQFVGTISYQYPPRRYNVPEGILKAGKNIITVRVITSSGGGAFIKDKPYELVIGDKTIDLKGEWKYKVGATAGKSPETTFFQYKPAGLFNAMINPVTNYPIAGVIWYQGESNTSRSKEYQPLFSTMIEEWRKKWKIGEFPFLFVQLANFMNTADQPKESQWAELREAQFKALKTPNTAMVVAHDLGEWNDIHPLNKQDVGKRLALAAQRLYYNDKKVLYSGPLYEKMQIKGNKVIISFTHKGSGLMAKGGTELKYFSIAGKEGKFEWAKAEIEGDKVVVWSDNISSPTAVRYAWADNPEGANLYNKEGLPASSFRTDN